MSPSAVYLVMSISATSDVVTLAALVWWVTSRKRLAAETIGRADDHARTLYQQAERNAESLKKEAQLEAREKSHTLLADAEKTARLTLRCSACPGGGRRRVVRCEPSRYEHEGIG